MLTKITKANSYIYFHISKKIFGVHFLEIALRIIRPK